MDDEGWKKNYGWSKGGLGLVIVGLGLMFGVGMGILLGVNEDVFKDFVAQGIAANPEVHDAKSPDKIWRYAQRAHFHSTGIAAFSLGLVFLAMGSSLKPSYKKMSAIFLALGQLVSIVLVQHVFSCPSIGREAAHAQLFAFTGVGGILLGTFLICANVFMGLFGEDRRA